MFSVIIFWFGAAMLTEAIDYFAPPLYLKYIKKDPDADPPTGWILIISGFVFLLGSFVFALVHAVFHFREPYGVGVLFWSFIFCEVLGLFRLYDKRRSSASKDWRDKI